MKKKKKTAPQIKQYFFSVVKSEASRSGINMRRRTHIEYFSYLRMSDVILDISLHKDLHIFSDTNLYKKEYRLKIRDIESIKYKTTFSLELPLITPVIVLFLCAAVLYALWSGIFIPLLTDLQSLSCNNAAGLTVGIVCSAGLVFLLLNAFAKKNIELRAKNIEVRSRKDADARSRLLIPVSDSLFISKENKIKLNELTEELIKINPDIDFML